jgi:hypothetical protein
MPVTHTEVSNIEESQYLDSVAAIATYLFAGRGKITILSEKSQVRHTYEVKVTSYRTKKGGHKKAYTKGPWKVYVRVGNTDGYGGHHMEYIGLVKRIKDRFYFVFKPGREINQGKDTRILGFRWLLRRINSNIELPDTAKVWRPHNCGRCGAELTSEYKLLSFGPICCKHLGIDSKLIFKTVASLGGGETREALEAARNMAYTSVLSRTDSLIASLLPGLAGSYLRDHLSSRQLKNTNK